MRTFELPFFVAMDGTAIQPGGTDILTIGRRSSNDPAGLYLVSADGMKIRTLIEPVPERDFSSIAWSPDGSQIAYARWEPPASDVTANPGDGVVRVHIMSADGTGDRIVGHKSGTWFEGLPTWSPDGKRLLIERSIGAVGDWDVGRAAAIVTVDGSAPEVAIDYHISPGVQKSWSPDGRYILAAPQLDADNRGQQLLWDTKTGASTRAPWTANSYPSWQRTAP